MGITNKTVMGNILQAAMKETRVGKALVGKQNEDAGDLFGVGTEVFTKTMLDLDTWTITAKALEENIRKSRIAGSVGQAFGGFAQGAVKGNYADAFAAIAIAFVEYTPKGRFAMMVIRASDAYLRNAYWEESYLRFVELKLGERKSPNVSDKNSYQFYSSGNYNSVFHPGGYINLLFPSIIEGELNKVRDKFVVTYAKANKMKVAKADDEVTSVRNAGWVPDKYNFLSKTMEKFRHRYENEKAIEAMAEEISSFIWIIEERTTLLERGKYGFAQDMDPRDRVRELFHARNSIYSIVKKGNKLPNEDLCLIMGMKYYLQSKRSGAFYDWMADMGYIDPLEKTPDAVGIGKDIDHWALVDTKYYDKDTKRSDEIKNMWYFTPNVSFRKSNAMTHSMPPSQIEANKSVSLRLFLSNMELFYIKDIEKGYGDAKYGGVLANAYVDAPEGAPQDGKSPLVLLVSVRDVVYDSDREVYDTMPPTDMFAYRNVSVTMPKGEKNGEKKAIKVCAFRPGAGVVYTYEWKKQDNVIPLKKATDDIAGKYEMFVSNKDESIKGIIFFKIAYNGKIEMLDELGILPISGTYNHLLQQLTFSNDQTEMHLTFSFGNPITAKGTASDGEKESVITLTKMAE